MRFPMAAAMLGLVAVAGAACASAQTLDDLNIQIHGFATQSYIYSTQNNWNTTDSSNGSAAWTEAVVNVTAQPTRKLRIGAQARYFLLGTYGNQITLDWAQGDYKVNERFGIRVGKVKTPSGMFNESQDIDPAQLWVLLPQSVYPISSRNSILAHYGAVAYGRVPLGQPFGSLDYRAFGGQIVLAGDDGYFQSLRDHGLALPNGVTGPMFGGTLIWNAPIPGLILGISELSEKSSGKITAGSLQGRFDALGIQPSYFFGKYERGKAMVAGEYNRVALRTSMQFPGMPAIVIPIDQRSFYVMGSYKLSEKLTGGLYYSSAFNLQAPLGPARYQKDWAITARWDFNPYLYAKVEEHVMDGTWIGYSTMDNTGGLKPDTKMTFIKVGVSF